MTRPICKECENHKDFWGRSAPRKDYTVFEEPLFYLAAHWFTDGKYYPLAKFKSYRCSNSHHWTGEEIKELTETFPKDVSDTPSLPTL